MKKVKRLIIRPLISLFIVLISGCTSYIANEFTTYTNLGFINKNPVTQQAARKHCVTPNQCLLYQELGVIPAIGKQPLGNSFNWALHVNGELAEQTKFTFPPLTEDAPVIFLFPGYSMSSSAALLPMGLWLRTLGFYVIAMPGPTEQLPFNFGRQSAVHAAAMIENRFADRKVYAYSYSMGSVALTDLQQQLKHSGKSLAAAIVTAPMLNFSSTAMQEFAKQREKKLRFNFISMNRFEAALDSVLRSANTNEMKLSFANRTRWLPNQVLLIASSADEMTPYSEIQALNIQNATLVHIENTNHIGLGLGLPKLRGEINAWLTIGGHLPAYPAYMQTKPTKL